MQSFTHFTDFSPKEINALVDASLEIKKGRHLDLQGKVLGMLFFNPSLRTRVSFETAMVRFGGHAVVLSGGHDVWTMAFQEGTRMDGNAVEHVKEAAKVLSRLCDAIAIRSFSSMVSFEKDLEDQVIHSFKKYATVPVISMESAAEHPCQALADMLTMKERLGNTQRKKFVLTWAPHIKALPTAVPHSALLAGVYSGMDVILTHPKGFELGSNYLTHVRKIAKQLKTSFILSDNQKEACANADVVYAKAWGATCNYGDKNWHDAHLSQLHNWQVDAALCQNAQLFLHCLPVRRNVEVADDILDSAKSAIYDQAENRFWAQAAVLEKIFGTEKQLPVF